MINRSLLCVFCRQRMSFARATEEAISQFYAHRQGPPVLKAGEVCCHPCAYEHLDFDYHGDYYYLKPQKHLAAS